MSVDLSPISPSVTGRKAGFTLVGETEDDVDL
jgi:hypothetical protein